MHQSQIRPPFGLAVQERFKRSSDNKYAVFTEVYHSIRRLVG
jgi:hypothetical protein